MHARELEKTFCQLHIREWSNFSNIQRTITNKKLNTKTEVQLKLGYGLKRNFSKKEMQITKKYF